MADDVKTAEPNWEELKPQIIKMALELGPLVVFFIVNTKGDDILKAFPALNQWFSSGIIFATVLTLFFLPALYVAWYRIKAPTEQVSNETMDPLPVEP